MQIHANHCLQAEAISKRSNSKKNIYISKTHFRVHIEHIELFCFRKFNMIFIMFK